LRRSRAATAATLLYCLCVLPAQLREVKTKFGPVLFQAKFSLLVCIFIVCVGGFFFLCWKKGTKVEWINLSYIQTVGEFVHFCSSCLAVRPSVITREYH
jgi:hypothetical protein